MSDLPWAEKYRPIKLDEVIGNGRAKAALRQWAMTWSKKGTPAQPGVILAGPPGVGKTTCAIAIAKEMSWDYIEMNASDRRTGKELRRIVLPGASTNTFSLDGDYFSLEEGKRHLIILDEADNIDSRDDIGGIAVVSELLKTTKQPVILIVNDLYELTRRSESIKKSCKVIRFEALMKDDIARVLHEIGDSEGVKISYDAAMIMIEMAGGDARAAINDMQSVALNGSITSADLRGMSKRNKTVDIREGVTRLFRSVDPKQSLSTIRLLEEDPGGLILWIDENMPSNSASIETLTAGFESLSQASRFIALAGRHSYYRLWSYANDMMALGAIIASGGYESGEQTKFPLILTKFRRRNAVISVRRGLLDKISKYAHTSPRNVYNVMLPFLRNAFDSSETFASAMTARLNLTNEELAALLDMPEDSAVVSRIYKSAFGPGQS